MLLFLLPWNLLEGRYLHHILYISYYFPAFTFTWESLIIFLSNLSSSGLSSKSPIRKFLRPAPTAFACSSFCSKPKVDIRYAAPVLPANPPNTHLLVFPTTLRVTDS